MQGLATRIWGLGWLAALLLCCAPSPGGAESSEPRNRASFRVQAQRSVENDRVDAVLVATAEEADPAQCAEQVNQAMAWALERARGHAGVSVKTTGYHTQPVYEEGRIRRWRARQELSLSSADSEAVVGIVTQLQSRLALQSFTFSLSPERRRRTEDALIEEALEGFRARAELIRRSMDARAWRLDDVNVDTNYASVPVHRLESARGLASSSLSAAPVAVEAGTSRVTIHVLGSIVLE